MASTRSTIVFFLAINLLLFTYTDACGKSCHHRKPPRPPKKPCPPSYHHGRGKCPIDTLKLAACANVLNGLLNVVIGTPPKTPCCTLIHGLADLEAALCLCTAIKANILGINLNVPVSLTALVNYCGMSVPRGFQCP